MRVKPGTLPEPGVLQPGRQLRDSIYPRLPPVPRHPATTIDTPVGLLHALKREPHDGDPIALRGSPIPTSTRRQLPDTIYPHVRQYSAARTGQASETPRRQPSRIGVTSQTGRGESGSIRGARCRSVACSNAGGSFTTASAHVSRSGSPSSDQHRHSNRSDRIGSRRQTDGDRAAFAESLVFDRLGRSGTRRVLASCRQLRDSIYPHMRHQQVVGACPGEHRQLW